MCELSPVSFHGDTIFCIDYHGEPFTPMKPIVENMGMDWRAQATKLRANKERWGVVIITTPSEGGEQETTCMPVRKLPAYLAGINPRKVKPELRPKIELYQAESDDALWDYWTKGRAERQPDALPDSITPDQQCTLRALVKARIEAIPEAERPKGLHPQIWSRFNNHFRLARYCQLPQCRMSEAVAYLTQMELTPAKALPAAPVQPRVYIDSQTCNKQLRIAADVAQVIRQVEALKVEARRWNAPREFRRTAADTGRAEDRYEIQSDLYRACNAALSAAVAALCASAEVGEWA